MTVLRWWLVAALAVGSAVAEPAAPLELTPAEKAEGWVWLFDGADASGWMGMDRTPFPTQTWVVEDGLLRTTEDGSSGDIQTIEEYRDFELVFDWKIAPGGNSGVKYCVQEEWISSGFKPDMPEARKADHSHAGGGVRVSDDRRLDPGSQPNRAGSCRRQAPSTCWRRRPRRTSIRRASGTLRELW